MLRSKLICLCILSALICSSCGEFTRILKSTDNELKYEIAMDYYDRQDYNKALQLFDLLQAAHRGTPQGENISYRTAMCYYEMQDYDIAGYYFNKFLQSYPFSHLAEKAAFMVGYCSFLQSPVSSLDQSSTHTAITHLQTFVDRYPKSDSIARVNAMIQTLNDKLEEKDYNICKLYYKMDNYISTIASFENLLKKYPNTKHREEALATMAQAYYKYAENSVPEKQRERFELCVERYTTLSYMFPESKYIKELESMEKRARHKLKNIQ